MAKSSKKSDATEPKTSKAAEKKPAAAKSAASKPDGDKPAKSSAGKSSVAKSSPAKSSPAKSSTTKSAPAPAPLIDTSLAASSAASMIAAGLSAKNLKPGGQAGKPESSLFKQLKSGLNKPHSAAMDSLLDKTHGPAAQKGTAFQKQVGHNQTTGSDAARINVPRRTNG
jgi:hypothetical protein